MNANFFSPFVTPVVIIGIVLLSGCVQQGTAFLTYDSPELGIRFNYPSDWTEEDWPSVSIAFSSPTGISGLLATVADLSDQPMTLDEYTKLTLANITRDETNYAIQSGAATLDDNPAHKVIYSKKLEKYNLTAKYMMVWTIKDEWAYVIGYYSTADKYSDAIADEAIRSFKIRPPTAQSTG